MSGIKYDENKPQMSLIDFEALEGLAKVLTFGANKYGADNWRGGIANSRIVSSLLRHLSAYQRGEDFDPESGLSHLDHIGCNWMFLSANAKQRPHCDDRSGRAGTHTGAGAANPGLSEAGHSTNTAGHLSLDEVMAAWQQRQDMEDAERALSDSQWFSAEAPAFKEWVLRDDVFNFPPEKTTSYVEVKFRDGYILRGPVLAFQWTLLGDKSDIVAYREAP